MPGRFHWPHSHQDRALPASDAIAFRLGQVDALARTWLTSPTHYSAEIRTALALRFLSRAWAQYREDRAIAAGAALVGAECAAERDAFLALLTRALPADECLLTPAVQLVRSAAIRPLVAEAAETAAIIEASSDVLDEVLTVLDEPKLPSEPLARVEALVERFRYSRGDEADPLAASALTPCWALNLAAIAAGQALRLSDGALPFPGIVSRRLFRADREPDARRRDASGTLIAALHATACDIAAGPRAAEVFRRAFPRQRRSSRLYQAWMQVYGFGGLTPAQLARALGATKAGAGKLLRQLAAARLVRGSGPFAPFVCAINLPVAFPDWHQPGEKGHDFDLVA